MTGILKRAGVRVTRWSREQHARTMPRVPRRLHGALLDLEVNVKEAYIHSPEHGQEDARANGLNGTIRYYVKEGVLVHPAFALPLSSALARIETKRDAFAPGLDALAAIDHPVATYALARLATRTRDEGASRAALEKLEGRSDKGEAVEWAKKECTNALKRKGFSDSGPVAIHAAALLGKPAVPFIGAQLSSSDAECQLAAIRSLGQIPTRESVEFLERVLNPNDRKRFKPKDPFWKDKLFAKNMLARRAAASIQRLLKMPGRHHRHPAIARLHTVRSALAVESDEWNIDDRQGFKHNRIRADAISTRIVQTAFATPNYWSDDYARNAARLARRVRQTVTDARIRQFISACFARPAELARLSKPGVLDLHVKQLRGMRAGLLKT